MNDDWALETPHNEMQLGMNSWEDNNNNNNNTTQHFRKEKEN